MQCAGFNVREWPTRLQNLTIGFSMAASRLASTQATPCCDGSDEAVCNRAWFSMTLGRIEVDDYVMSVRAVRGGKYVADVGKSSFLVVPDGADPQPDQTIPASRWFDQVRKAGEWKNADGLERGDILFVAHGYNNSEAEVMQRHRLLKTSLAALGFKGVIVSFDWPSDNEVLAYLADRHRAKATAHLLVEDGIARLSARQTCDCPVNIHLFGHSTGAYVIREAFDDADDTQLKQSSWLVSQILFASGDVSARSMAAGNARSESLYLHCVRLTNYNNHRDTALDLSNVKRLGLAPRAGRSGLPDDAPDKAVNVDCTAYYDLYDSSAEVRAADGPAKVDGLASHSWYFGNAVFARDLFETVIGVPAQRVSTRTTDSGGKLQLSRPASGQD